MPDRSDPPEYDWLYGKRKAAGAGSESASDATSGADDEAEPTRVMPRPPRRDNYARPPAPGTPAVTPSAPPARKRRLPWGRIVLLVLVAWIAYLVAVPFIAWNRIDQVDASPSGSRPADQPGTTYLLVGSDSRKGLTRKENRRLGTGGVGDVGQRTDTIMLLHTGDGPSLLLSIPRDSIVPIPGHGTTKINAAFAYGGPKLLVKTIEQNTGVHVDHYVEIGFGGFVNSVDAVGGITICPTKRMVDRRANLNIKKGCQHVNGITALGYARSRHTSGIGDIDRARHQREVVSAIGDKVKSPWTILNPFRYWDVNMAATSSIKVDKDSGVIDLARFAWAMTRVNGKDGLTCSMPIRDLAVHWDTQRALALLKLIKTDRTGDIPKSLCLPTGIANQ
ncbi:MAG TPA: LCP family protein [Marmoricola sp.]|jgi:LCP family protein required for cell wall assembly|nr:LCP family protein [Marmoricola sp.]